MVELQDCVSRLQTLNNELQNRLSLLEKSKHDAYGKEDKDVASSSPWKQVRGHKTAANGGSLGFKVYSIIL